VITTASESVAEAVDERAGRTRAQPMAPEERRRMIAEQAVPLFLEHGSALTTRQLADELGIAEGTIFRAFGDKESLVRAAVQTFFENSRARMADGIVDATLPIDEKVSLLVRGTREWMQSMFRMLSLIPRDQIPEVVQQRGGSPDDDDFQRAVIAAFQPDEAELTMPVDRIGAVMNIAGVAANAGRFGASHGLSDDELVHFILYGIAGAPRSDSAKESHAR